MQQLTELVLLLKQLILQQQSVGDPGRGEMKQQQPRHPIARGLPFFHEEDEEDCQYIAAPIVRHHQVTHGTPTCELQVSIGDPAPIVTHAAQASVQQVNYEAPSPAVTLSHQAVVQVVQKPVDRIEMHEKTTIPHERVQHRIVEHVVDVPTPRHVPKVFPQERVQQRSVESNFDVPVSMMQEEVLEVPEVFPHELIQHRTVDVDHDILVPMMLGEFTHVPDMTPQEHFLHSSFEMMIDVQVPMTQEETMHVPTVIPQERVQHKSNEMIAEVPAPMIQSLTNTEQPGPTAIAPEDDLMDELDEEIEALPDDEKYTDPLFHAKIRREVSGLAFLGQVEDIEVGKTTKDRLYLIRYDDGDIEHLTELQVKEYQV